MRLRDTLQAEGSIAGPRTQASEAPLFTRIWYHTESTELAENCFPSVDSLRDTSSYGSVGRGSVAAGESGRGVHGGGGCSHGRPPTCRKVARGLACRPSNEDEAENSKPTEAEPGR